MYNYFRAKEKDYTQYLTILVVCHKLMLIIIKAQSRNSSSAVEVCPNSIEPLSMNIDECVKSQIREKYGIPPGTTVFIYGGNLGKPQGIDFLIECLKSNRSNERVHFIIVGSGTEFNKIKAYLAKDKPINVQLFNQLPKDDYEILVNACDVGLIFLDKRFTIPNFPSRLLSYMQACMPVLAATDVTRILVRLLRVATLDFGVRVAILKRSISDYGGYMMQICEK